MLKLSFHASKTDRSCVKMTDIPFLECGKGLKNLSEKRADAVLAPFTPPRKGDTDLITASRRDGSLEKEGHKTAATCLPSTPPALEL